MLTVPAGSKPGWSAAQRAQRMTEFRASTANRPPHDVISNAASNLLPGSTSEGKKVRAERTIP
jgi:hypothetical protein